MLKTTSHTAAALLAVAAASPPPPLNSQKQLCFPPLSQIPTKAGRQAGRAGEPTGTWGGRGTRKQWDWLGMTLTKDTADKERDRGR